MSTIYLKLAAAALLAAALSGCDPAADESAAPAAAAAPAAPSAGDREYARITAAWAPQALEACGPGLREVLGTRDLVQGALDGVKDTAGKAAAELEDARHWLAEGDAMLTGVKEKLESGTCDGDIQVALDEAVQFYVKSGTSAVQAGQIAGS